LLGAARNAVGQKNWTQALARFEEYFRRFGDDFDIRKEYAGVLVQAGRLPLALREYQRLINRSPGDRDLRVTAGDVAVLAKDYPLAVTHLQQALKLAPGDLEISTKLARALIFNEDFPQALQIFEKNLAQLQPDDEKVPRSFGALLIDLERPGDAVPFLKALLEKQPDDAEALASLLRAYARLGDRPRALAVLQDLARRAPHAVSVRQELGDALYASGDYDLAGAVYEQILQIEPENGFAQVGIARVQLQMFQPQSALKVLNSIKPDAAVDRLVRLTRAEYHQLVGEYLEAKQVYLQFLRQNESDHEVRLALAKLYEFIREDEKAKAEYAKLPPNTSLGRRGRIGIASTLTAQRHFPEAVEVARCLLAENPNDGGAMAQLVRTLAKAEQFDTGESQARLFLENNARNEPALFSVRLALAKLLLDARKYQEAAQEYELLLARPNGHLPATYYGLAQALDKLGKCDQAKQLLANVTTLVGGETRDRLLLADQYAGDFADSPVIELTQAVLKCDPDNLAALIRLADVQERVARMTWDIKEAVQTAQTILSLSPTNVRGHLALARNLSTGQDFKASVAAYEPLIVADRTFQVPQRERARVLYSDHQYDAGAAAYAQMQMPPADAVLRMELDAYLRREPKVGPLLAPYLLANLAPPVLKGEVLKAAIALGDSEILAALQRIFLDYGARSVEQTGARLEGEAKDKSWRHYEMIPIAKSLLSLEPDNTSMLFDLGQNFSSLKQTRNALEQYALDVKIDPGEYESLVALERASLEMRPQLHYNFDYFQQRGRDGLARIQWEMYNSTLRWPYGDEDEFFSLGFTRVNYVPRDDRTLEGNIVSGGFESKACCDRLHLAGLVNLESYRDRLKDRVTFDTNARYDFCDLVQGRAGLFLKNVTENGESLRQDIFRFGGTLGADVQPTRLWSLEGTYLFDHYSDSNDQNEWYFKSNYQVLPPPCEFKAVLTADLQTFRNQTVFRTADTNFLLGTIHPYFSPSFYSYCEGRLEWKQWLSRDYFVHSNQCWYSVQGGLGWDNNFNSYETLRALANFDLKPWLSIGADVRLIFSRVYDMTSAVAYVIVRLPCR
jgi:tetratricopeptide (TPR) repeat protein